MKLIVGLTPDKQIAKKYLGLFKNQNLLLRLTNEANSVYVQSLSARTLKQILNRHMTLTKKAPETLCMLVYGGDPQQKSEKKCIKPVPGDEVMRTQYVCWMILLTLQCFKALEISTDTDSYI